LRLEQSLQRLYLIKQIPVQDILIFLLALRHNAPLVAQVTFDLIQQLVNLSGMILILGNG
jgi:hypothetical protein